MEGYRHMNLLAHIRIGLESIYEKAEKNYTFSVPVEVESDTSITFTLYRNNENRPILESNWEPIFAKHPNVPQDLFGHCDKSTLTRDKFRQSFKHGHPVGDEDIYRAIIYDLERLRPKIANTPADCCLQGDHYYRIYEPSCTSPEFAHYIDVHKRYLHDPQLMGYPDYEFVNLHSLMSVIGNEVSKLSAVTDILYKNPEDERSRIMENCVIISKTDPPYCLPPNPIHVLVMCDPSYHGDRDTLKSGIASKIKKEALCQHCFRIIPEISFDPSFWREWSSDPRNHDMRHPDCEYAVKSNVISTDDAWSAGMDYAFFWGAS